MKVELLAPGGSYETVIAALNAGADAVYTGGEKFGARAFANNLSLDELKEVIDYAHIHDKKIYLTINTLFKEDEINKELYDYILPLYIHGLDAVIVQDMGVIKFIKENFPGLHIHASTQMTIFGAQTVKKLEKYGVERIVTPRELSLEEISDIRKNTNVEIESFVHGALCYCYSGQCFLSSYIGGRSGNRGKCAQPCRMEYDVFKDDKLLNQGNCKYVLSPKDMCTLEILPEIINAGVFSLKIEGRMKKKEYTAGVVSIYRKYIDMYLSGADYEVHKNDIKLLADLFNRNGFNESYYKMHNGKSMISLKKPEFRTENKEFVDFINKEIIDKKLRKSTHLFVRMRKDKLAELTLMAGDDAVTVYGDVPDNALNRPTDEEMIIKRMNKLGNTDFEADMIEVELDDNLFMTVGSLNELRRDGIEALKKVITDKYKREIPLKKLNENTISCGNNITETKLSILVSSYKQFMSVMNAYKAGEIDSFLERIYIEAPDFNANEIDKVLKEREVSSVNIYLAMPYVFRKDDKETFEEKYNKYINKFDGVLIRNIEQYFWLQDRGVVKKYIFDYNVYVNNSFAKEYLNELNSSYGDDTIQFTTPVELNFKECMARGATVEEFIIYGYMPVMTSAGCIGKTCNQCNKNKETYVLKDRKAERFNVKCVCDYCYNLMYNSKPLSLFGSVDKIKKLHVRNVRLSFTFEDKSTIEEVIKKVKFALNEELVKDDENTTRGHFNRGVL